MSDTVSLHPDAGKLSEFGLGRLPPDEACIIEAHLDTCPSCRTLVEGLSDDSLVLLLRESVHSEPAAPIGGGEAATLAAVPGSSPVPGDTSPGVGPATSHGIPPELAGHPRYRVLEVLGSGGMGTVFRARHLLMDREVALKLVNRSLLDSPTLVERFRREVKTAARLTHPNIVTAHDAEQAGDWHFLVMEYVPGISLSRLVAEKGRLGVTEACQYVYQAATGLQHAFECGMVHRDIKPQNLMRTPAGQVKILDFGLSRLGDGTAAGPETAGLTAIGRGESGLASGSLTQTGSIMGTPDYIAPEQIRDAHAADIRADIYSLGCTLYHLLAGQPPFSGVTEFDKVLAHLERAPRPLQELRPEVPAKLSAVVARMMAKSPQDRFQTPAEAATALAPFAGVAPPARPRWVWGVAAAALLMLAAGMGIVAFVAGNRRSSGPPTPAGEIVVDSPEKTGLLEFKQEGRRVRILDLQNEVSCRLEPGDYDVALTNKPDDLYLPVERCQVAEGEKTTVQVRRVEVVREFKDTTGNFVCVAFTPDGRRVLSGGSGNPLKMWDVATEKVLRVFDCPGPKDVWAIAVSPDGRSVAWGAGSIVRLSDLENGKAIGTFLGHKRTVVSVAFSPDGSRLLSSAGSDGGGMRLWDVKSKWQLDQFSVDSDVGWSVTFTPDGLHALCSRFVRFNNLVPLQLWDLQTRMDEHRLDDSRGTFKNVAIVSADGRRVLAGCDEKMTLWDLETGKELQRFTGHKNQVRSVAFLPDGRHVLSGSYDGTARVWDMDSGRQLYSFNKHKGAIKAVAIAADGCHALTAGVDKVIRLWRMPVPDPIARTPVTDGELVVETPENAGLLVIRQKGRLVRVLDLQKERTCKLDVGDYDFVLTNAPDDLNLLVKRCHIASGAKATIRVDQGKVVGVYKGLTLRPTETRGGVCVAVTADGKRVLAGGWANPLRMWDAETGTEQRVFDCPGPNNVFAVAVSPDGLSVAWGAGPIVRLSELESGKQIGTFEGHKGHINCVAFSPDGKRLLSGGEDGTMRLWDVKRRKELDKPFLISADEYVWGVAFTSDGLHALSCRSVKSDHLAALQLWDLQTRTDLHRLDASRGTLHNNAAVLSPDGRRVLSGGADKMRLWDLETGKELQRFSGHKHEVRGVAFLPDGHRVLSVSYDGTAKIWDVESGRQLYNFTKHRGAIKGVAIAPDGHSAFTVDDQGLVIRWQLPQPDAAPKR